MNNFSIFAGLFFITCLLVGACHNDNGKAIDDNRGKSGDANPDPGDDGSPPTPGNGGEDDGDDDGDGHGAVPTTFTVDDLLQTAGKATNRFERLAVPNSSFHNVKTWKSESYAWAKLKYIVKKDNADPTEEYLYLACHFHGEHLGCHKKEETDPSEPEDTPADDDLPTIDDELPPIEEISPQHLDE